jgi:hypothetical protein
MIPIPARLRADMAKDPYYKRCARQDLFHDHVCQERKRSADPTSCVMALP